MPNTTLPSPFVSRVASASAAGPGGASVGRRWPRVVGASVDAAAAPAAVGAAAAPAVGVAAAVVVAAARGGDEGAAPRARRCAVIVPSHVFSPSVGSVLWWSGRWRSRPVPPVALDEPAVELDVALLLPRVAAARREAAVHAPLDLGGGVLVLADEHLHAGVAHREQVVEHRVLERARVEQVADLDVDRVGRLRA